MAKDKLCYCPNCNGGMRAATTMKEHATKAAEVEAANVVKPKAQGRQHRNNIL